MGLCAFGEEKNTPRLVDCKFVVCFYMKHSTFDVLNVFRLFTQTAVICGIVLSGWSWYGNSSFPVESELSINKSR